MKIVHNIDGDTVVYMLENQVHAELIIGTEGELISISTSDPERLLEIIKAAKTLVAERIATGECPESIALYDAEANQVEEGDDPEVDGDIPVYFAEGAMSCRSLEEASAFRDKIAEFLKQETGTEPFHNPESGFPYAFYATRYEDQDTILDRLDPDNEK